MAEKKKTQIEVISAVDLAKDLANFVGSKRVWLD